MSDDQRRRTSRREVWTRRGLVTLYVLLVIRLKTREVEIAGVTASPDTAWITQVGRNLTNHEDGFLRDATHLILDRDTKFLPLRKYLRKHTPVRSVILPPRSPDLNAYLERVCRSMKEECLDRLIFFSERSLRHALRQWTAHYLAERNHQGLDNRLIDPIEVVGRPDGGVTRHDRLGGLLRYSYRDAA